jgi:hypothetical protein
MIEKDVSVCVFDTPKCLILTRQKIGTQFVRTFFHDDLNKNLIPPEIDITPAYNITRLDDKFEIEKKFPQIDFSEKFDYHLESFDKFLNTADFDKDVIILIRNPWKRFVSALIQDFIKPFIGPNNSRILEVFGQVILTKDELDWWINNRHEIDKFILDQDRLETPPDKFIECFEKIVEKIIEGWYNGKYPILSLHNGEYLSVIESILKAAPNLNKVNIFDIDEVDLNDVFSKYRTNSEKIEKQNVSNILTDITLRVLDKLDIIKDMIVSELKSEAITYNNLKNKDERTRFN